MCVYRTIDWYKNKDKIVHHCQDRNKKDKTIHCSLLFCIHWLYLKANFDVLISDRGWDPEVFRCRCDRSHTTRHSHNGRWVRQLTSSLLKYTHATFSWCKSPFVDSHCKQNLDNCFHIYWSILFCFALGVFMQSNRNQKFLCIFHQLYLEANWQRVLPIFSLSVIQWAYLVGAYNGLFRIDIIYFTTIMRQVITTFTNRSLWHSCSCLCKSKIWVPDRSPFYHNTCQRRVPKAGDRGECGSTGPVKQLSCLI